MTVAYHKVAAVVTPTTIVVAAKDGAGTDEADPRSRCRAASA